MEAEILVLKALPHVAGFKQLFLSLARTESQFDFLTEAKMDTAWVFSAHWLVSYEDSRSS